MSELLDALRDLRVFHGTLRQHREAAVQRSTVALPGLVAAIERLGQARAAKPLQCPRDYIAKWLSTRDGRSTILSRRAVRYLHWEPDVVTDLRFQRFLDSEGHRVTAHGIQGLVRACHKKWTEFLKSKELQRTARQRLLAYRGPNQVVSRWQQDADSILGPEAPQQLARVFVGDTAPTRLSTELGLDEGSPFFEEVMAAAVSLARENWRSMPQLSKRVSETLLPWSGWPLGRLKEQVSACIMDRESTAEHINQPLKAFVLTDPRLGDPRLPQNQTKWAGVPVDVKRRFIGWLSKDDIVFFFEHAFPRGGDRQRRKPFWLRYVNHIALSRPLLGVADHARLQPIIRQNRTEVGHFGRMNGDNSAFWLDFGPLVAVEFNNVGACYVYPRSVVDQVVPDFWAASSFRESDLKRRDLLPNETRYRIVHREGWEQELARLLAQHGIRP